MTMTMSMTGMNSLFLEVVVIMIVVVVTNGKTAESVVVQENSVR